MHIMWLFAKGVKFMNMYVVFALFMVSCAVILACLDHFKMRVARNLFWVLTLVLFMYIPVAIWGCDIADFCLQHQSDSFAHKVLVVVNNTIDACNVEFASVTLLLTVLALFFAISTVIVVVQAACAICKFVQGWKQKHQHPKVPQKQNYQRKLVNTKIQYKRTLYLRLCRLNS